MQFHVIQVKLPQLELNLPFSNQDRMPAPLAFHACIFATSCDGASAIKSSFFLNKSPIQQPRLHACTAGFPCMNCVCNFMQWYFHNQELLFFSINPPFSNQDCMPAPLASHACIVFATAGSCAQSVNVQHQQPFLAKVWL